MSRRLLPPALASKRKTSRCQCQSNQQEQLAQRGVVCLERRRALLSARLYTTAFALLVMCFKAMGAGPDAAPWLTMKIATAALHGRLCDGAPSQLKAMLTMKRHVADECTDSSRCGHQLNRLLAITVRPWADDAAALLHSSLQTTACGRLPEHSLVSCFSSCCPSPAVARAQGSLLQQDAQDRPLPRLREAEPWLAA